MTTSTASLRDRANQPPATCVPALPLGQVPPRLVLVVLSSLLATACVPPAPPPPRPAAAPAARAAQPAADHARRVDGLTGGVLVFEDNFERGELGGDWEARQPGEWTIEKGRMRAGVVPNRDDRNKGVWLKRPLPAQVRVEFEAEVLSPKGDIKCEIFASDPTHEAGYSVIFGGWGNTINTIARKGEHEPARVVQRPHVSVERNKRHRWTLVRSDRVLRWYVDGKFMLAYDDAAPVQGPHFAFNNWESDVRFDGLRVFDLQPAPAR